MKDRTDIKRERVEVIAAGPRVDVRDKLGDVWWSLMLRGVLALALGAFAVFWPSLSLGILALVVGIYCIADGAAVLISARRTVGRRELLLRALISLAIGLVLVFWPGGSVRTLLFLFGAWALFTGIGQIATARRLEAVDPDRGAMMTVGVVAAIVGLVLLFWPGSGVVAISWVIAVAALLVGGVLIYLAIRFRRLEQRIDTRDI